MGNTMRAFKDEIRNAPKIRTKVIENMSSHKTTKIVTNLFSLEYNFENEKILIFYYIEDSEYPDEILSFSDFKKLIQEL